MSDNVTGEGKGDDVTILDRDEPTEELTPRANKTTDFESLYKNLNQLCKFGVVAPPRARPAGMTGKLFGSHLPGDMLLQCREYLDSFIAASGKHNSKLGEEEVLGGGGLCSLQV